MWITGTTETTCKLQVLRTQHEYYSYTTDTTGSTDYTTSIRQILRVLRLLRSTRHRYIGYYGRFGHYTSTTDDTDATDTTVIQNTAERGDPGMRGTPWGDPESYMYTEKVTQMGSFFSGLGFRIFPTWMQHADSTTLHLLHGSCGDYM